MSDRDLTSLAPGTRALEQLARRVRMIELGHLRGPGSSFALPFQLASHIFDEDALSHLLITSGGVASLAVDSLASEAWSAWSSASIRQNGVGIIHNLIYANFEVFSRLCIVEFNTTVVGAGVAGTEIDVVAGGIPTPADTTYRPVGVGVYYDISAGNWYRILVFIEAGRFRFLRFDASGASNFGVTPAITANFGDLLFFQAIYRTT